MSELPTPRGLAPGVAPQPKVLICTIDDAWFGIRTDWVNAVCPSTSTSVQTLRVPDGKPQRLVLFQNEPALMVEMRAVAGLGNDEPERDQYALVRSGACVAALPIDRCVGIRSLDLDTRAPVPSRIRRGDGMPVGHIVDVDGRMLVVLDPQHLLDTRTRGLWPAALRRADALQKRQAKLDSLWSEIRVEPSAASVRSYAALCSRSGRSRTALAARSLLSYLPNGDPPSTNPPSADGVIRSLLQAAEEKRTGRLIVDGNGSGDAALDLLNGRVVDVRRAHRSGSTALAELLTAADRGTRFLDRQPESSLAERRGTSAVAVLIEALEAAVPEKRRRRGGGAA